MDFAWALKALTVDVGVVVHDAGCDLMHIHLVPRTIGVFETLGPILDVGIVSFESE